MEKHSINYKYLIRSPRDIDWGITVNTVGSEPVPPNYPIYPPRTGHPDAFYFTPSRGRVLDSYQLLYITRGKGYFYPTPDTFIEIKEGDILILQPHVWHSYFPDKKTGWQEYWIGFQGVNMDSRFQNNFLPKTRWCTTSACKTASYNSTNRPSTWLWKKNQPASSTWPALPTSFWG